MHGVWPGIHCVTRTNHSGSTLSDSQVLAYFPTMVCVSGDKKKMVLEFLIRSDSNKVCTDTKLEILHLSRRGIVLSIYQLKGAAQLICPFVFAYICEILIFSGCGSCYNEPL